MQKLLALWIAATIGLSGPAFSASTDNFFADDVLAGKWIAASGNPASKISVNRTLGLSMWASAQNGGSDLSNGTNFNAPTVFQGIGASLNWTVTVSLVFNDCNCSAALAGIVLGTQPGKFTSETQFLRALERERSSYGGDVLRSGIYNTNTATNVSADIMQLRVRKVGSNYTTSYSVDGIHYTVIETFTDSRSFTYIGLDSIRQPFDGNTALDEEALFTDFELQ